MNRRISWALIGAALVMGPVARALAGDWPTWGGRADRDMVSGETGLPEVQRVLVSLERSA